MRRTTSCILTIMAALLLAACPPNRGNLPDAEGGGYGEPGFFAWRESGYGDAPEWAILFIPRDEDHDCEGMIGYDWSDADMDYARFNISKARVQDWAGMFVNNYLGCGSWYDSDRRCFDGFDYREGTYEAFQQESRLELTTWDDTQVRGAWLDNAGEEHTFRAENCGQLPYYYDDWAADAGREGRSHRSAAGGEGPRAGSWTLRFR